MIWPLSDYTITRGFDYPSSIYVGGLHAAIDLMRATGPTLGSPILAVDKGSILGDAWDPYSGYFVGQQLPGGWVCFYRHLFSDAPPVVGQIVQQGEVIAYVGSTGLSSGPHLHFDLWHREKQDATAFYKNGWWAHDPELYLGKGEPESIQEEVMAKLIKRANGRHYITDGVFRVRVDEGEGRLRAAKALWGPPVLVDDDLVDVLINAKRLPLRPAGG